DSALVTVLAQITSLDPVDQPSLRELARVYESLQRWRDLLTTQSRLAELDTDVGVKGELYRAVARRWLDQFSNVQNAVEAYEKLHVCAPEDREAIEKLKELYTKRRAYKPLYELLEQEAAAMPEGQARRASAAPDDATRLAVLQKLGAVYSDRLHDHAGAMKTWKRVLEIQPGHQKALRVLRDSHLAIGDFDGLSELYAQNKDWEGL